MERTVAAFFYTARTFGINPTVISLTEQTHLNWHGRLAYMTAKFEQRRTELYAMDLIWMLAKAKCEITSAQPSAIEYGKDMVDHRSAEQIKQDILRKVQGK